ncbi:unnamed protein product [Moneuplotes crassus]|uniref:Uncharacterized protein n=1 Tax=Euplotes crassus TaxID=5936 RepID=A0AAD1XTD7_EUPCR|nr:unnamed protein product [Moneuplotes crassus]
MTLYCLNNEFLSFTRSFTIFLIFPYAFTAGLFLSDIICATCVSSTVSINLDFMSNFSFEIYFSLLFLDLLFLTISDLFTSLLAAIKHFVCILTIFSSISLNFSLRYSTLFSEQSEDCVFICCIVEYLTSSGFSINFFMICLFIKSSYSCSLCSYFFPVWTGGSPEPAVSNCFNDSFSCLFSLFNLSTCCSSPLLFSSSLTK